MSGFLSADKIRLALRRFVREHDPAAALFDELPLCRGIGRADLAAVNGAITGYEIKSERDSLARLPKQISDYGRVFDFCYVALTERHVEKACLILPPMWGVLLIGQRLDQQPVVEVRPAQRNTDVDFVALIRLLWKPEVVRLLRQLGSESKATISVAKLWHELASAPSCDVTQGIREMLKLRAARESARP